MLILIIAYHPTQTANYFGSLQLSSLIISILTGDQFFPPANLKVVEIIYRHCLKVTYTLKYTQESVR